MHARQLVRVVAAVVAQELVPMRAVEDAELLVQLLGSEGAEQAPKDIKRLLGHLCGRWRWLRVLIWLREHQQQLRELVVALVQGEAGGCHSVPIRYLWVRLVSQQQPRKGQLGIRHGQRDEV
jgi:hypothetical protein